LANTPGWSLHILSCVALRRSSGERTETRLEYQLAKMTAIQDTIVIVITFYYSTKGGGCSIYHDHEAYSN
jgi:hypothetical protein